MNPFSAMFSLNYQRNKAKEKAMEEAKAAAAKQILKDKVMGFDFAGTGRYTGADTKSEDYDGNLQEVFQVHLKMVEQ